VTKKSWTVFLPLCQVMKVVFKMKKVIRILW
jgi:hypothetical protein